MERTFDRNSCQNFISFYKLSVSCVRFIYLYLDISLTLEVVYNSNYLKNWEQNNFPIYQYKSVTIFCILCLFFGSVLGRTAHTNYWPKSLPRISGQHTHYWLARVSGFHLFWSLDVMLVWHIWWVRNVQRLKKTLGKGFSWVLSLSM